jgi:hypothetical protein
MSILVGVVLEDAEAVGWRAHGRNSSPSCSLPRSRGFSELQSPTHVRHAICGISLDDGSSLRKTKPVKLRKWDIPKGRGPSRIASQHRFRLHAGSVVLKRMVFQLQGGIEPLRTMRLEMFTSVLNSKFTLAASQCLAPRSIKRHAIATLGGVF